MPWHEKNPSLFEKEKAKMEEKYPAFLLSFQRETGNPVWKGETRLMDQDRSCLYSMQIEIRTEDCYPRSIPRVFPIGRELTGKDCNGHIFSDGALCYGNRLDEKLSPEKICISNVVDHMQFYTTYLWKFSNTGKWGAEHLHGIWAFIDHEVNVRKIPQNELCPCGGNCIYKECCYPKVKKELQCLNQYMSITKNRIAPNHRCVCGSGKKYKHCCRATHSHRHNLIHIPLFRLLKFPMIDPEQSEKILMFSEKHSDFNELVKKSPLGQRALN